MHRIASLVALLLLLAAAPARAAEADPFTLGGWVEAYFQWNANDPSNGLTNVRGFDARHSSFTLSNVALDAQYDREAVLGRLTLQVGAAPSTYYLAEPVAPGSGGVAASGPEVWKYVQQAWAGWRPGGDGPLTLSAGLFLSPIGPESIAVKDDWAFSRSNLFFGLPFYHSGVRASYALSDVTTVTLAGWNGWNSVVDNNDEKSVSLQWARTTKTLALSALYFGGVERPREAPEGRAWRHLVDAHATWSVTEALALQLHGDVGVEPNDLGTSRWLAGALAARYQLREGLWLAARADAFQETVAKDGDVEASAIFWPVEWVASGTGTLEYRPVERVSLRLEVRHDRAEDQLFFGGEVEGDGGATPYVPNRDAQTTATLGVTTWF